MPFSSLLYPRHIREQLSSFLVTPLQHHITSYHFDPTSFPSSTFPPSSLSILSHLHKTTTTATASISSARDRRYILCSQSYGTHQNFHFTPPSYDSNHHPTWPSLLRPASCWVLESFFSSLPRQLQLLVPAISSMFPPYVTASFCCSCF